MDKNLKRKELMALGVHDLRNIARSVGVVGPTMKVKEQIVEEIIEIMSGEMQANSNVKRGRKAKANFLTGEAIMSLPAELTSILQAREQQNKTMFGKNLGYLSLNQDSVSTLVEYADRQGYLLCENGVFYFFDDSQQKSMVYIPEQLNKKIGLKIGDKVLVKCQKMPGNNIYLGKEIIEINGCTATSYKRNLCKFDDFAKSSTKWFCDEITEGDLKLVSFYDAKKFIADEKSLFEYCKENSIFVWFFDVDCSIPEQELIDKEIKNGEVVHAYSDRPESCFEMLINAVNNTIARVEAGEKVLLVLLKFNQIYDTLKSLIKTTNLTSNDMQQIIGKIQNLNRILKNNGSLTTLVANIEVK